MSKMKKIETLCLQELSLKQLKMWLEEDQDAILNKVSIKSLLIVFFFCLFLVSASIRRLKLHFTRRLKLHFIFHYIVLFSLSGE